MLRFKIFSICLAASLLLSGCATVFLNDSNDKSLSGLGEPRTLEMQMQITRGDTSFAMDLVADVHNQGLTVIGSAFGARIFTLSFDGNLISEGVGLGLPITVSNRLIVDDVILTLATLKSLEVGLPKGCAISVDGDWRKIYCNEQLIVKIKHQKMADKNELVSIERLQPEYKVNFVISEAK
ncbi:DUF3261 domain-containing protein [Polynucleobacter sp. MWH-Braz-FAM2G]|uniref:DUF3261 domain-containing protein n=1 Tax=Polynucleobacter sp. MWH-Braz-FAM2G TaxID=1855883 RepID=UPI001BFCFF9E|nr:DUF3261 domain-containing protein [Polynucleobacter sp. MWH-Braz-FAM2G]QWD91640.1 DUF3261 domain-containing protein [Polynucleobacter sp. MWH-Braz-FAM2G]